MPISEKRRAADNRRILATIKKYGYHCISVFDPENKTPSFSYSIGIQASTSLPEAIVLGVSSTLGYSMIKKYYNQVCQGTEVKCGTPYHGFHKRFPIFIEPALPSLLEEYTLGCGWYYEEKTFSVVQLIYSSTTGVWPWQSEASEWFRDNQPMLGRKAPNLA